MAKDDPKSITAVRIPYAGQRIKVGGMELTRNLRQRLWLENRAGEGLELNMIQERELEMVLRAFHNKYF